ncbi:MAG: phosphoglycerate dehydrogenase [Halobacteriota archaeon]
MKVLICDPLSQEGIDILQREADADVITDLTPEQLIHVIKDYDALIVRSGTKVSREIIEASNLKVIGRAGVGVDNIDIDAATAKGIIVINSPEGNMISAAEHTISLMMALSRNIPQATQSVKSGEWNRSKFTGVELFGKTLGVLGLGRIGAEVAKRMRAMGMNVLAYDPFVTVERAKELRVEVTSLQDVLKNSDYITVHTPLTKDTHHMIGIKEIEMMRDGVRILNVARGGIIDEDALYKGLVTGKVAGAALDVFEHEPPIGNKLMTLDNVIMTPHLGASTVEAQINVAISIAEQTLLALKGEPVRNAVNVPIRAETFGAIRSYMPLAEKLGKFCIQLVEGQIQGIEVIYNGDVGQCDVHPLTIAVIKGALDHVLQSPVNFVNAEMFAKKRGIRMSETKTGAVEDFTSLITVRIKSDRGDWSAAGTLFLGDQPRIVKIGNYHVDAETEGCMLITSHIDKPGVIGRVGTLLGGNNINIAGMNVGRDKVRGKAVMVLALDDPLTDEILAGIIALDGISTAKAVVL